MVELYSVVRSLHLLFAVLWGGGSIYHGAIAMGFMNHNAEARARWWMQGKFGPFLGITSLLTVAFGLWYFLGADTDYSSVENAVLGVGMLAGTIGMVVGWAGHMPTMIKLAKAVEAGDDETVEKLERREHKLDKVSFITVLLAILGMASYRLAGTF